MGNQGLPWPMSLQPRTLVANTEEEQAIATKPAYDQLLYILTVNKCICGILVLSFKNKRDIFFYLGNGKSQAEMQRPATNTSKETAKPLQGNNIQHSQTQTVHKSQLNNDRMKP